MGMVAEFDFETLEPLAPPRAPVSEAEAVMDVLAEARAEADSIRAGRARRGLRRGSRRGAGGAGAGAGRAGAAVDAVRVEQAATAEELERRAVELGWRWRRRCSAARSAVEPERVARLGPGRAARDRRARAHHRHGQPGRSRDRARGDGGAAGVARRHRALRRRGRAAGRRGGCIVRTPVGDIDARVETKLERASEVVAAALGRS